MAKTSRWNKPYALRVPASMISKSALRHRVVRIAVITCRVYLIVSLAGGILLLESALHPSRLPLVQRETLALLSAPWSLHSVEDVSINAADGAVLKAWFVEPRKANGNAVILLHGVGDNREGAIGYARFLLQAGYAVLLPDSRAHGESGGNRATYGLLESDDIRHWTQWVQSSTSRHSCVDLLGESLGAALAIQAARLPVNCAVVAEAPFASFREIGYERIAQGFHMSSGASHVLAWPMVNFAFLYARVRYGYHLDDASPEKQLAASHVPTLLIAGTADDNIPPRHSEQILRSAAAGSELWHVANAGHTGAMSTAPEEFQRRVLAWFESHANHFE